MFAWLAERPVAHRGFPDFPREPIRAVLELEEAVVECRETLDEVHATWKVIQLLELDAIVRVEDGDAAGALTDCQAGLMVARWLRDFERFAEDTVARARRVTERGKVRTARPPIAVELPPRRLFGIAFESRPPPVPA